MYDFNSWVKRISTLEDFSDYKNHKMNILFSSDNNYVRHLGVAIYSLLSNNSKFDNIRIFVVQDNIDPENLQNLQKIVGQFNNAELVFIPYKHWSDRLHLNMSWPISMSAYARLFIGDMLPSSIDKVLYLDSDMLINDDLSEIWNANLGDKIVGAVQDQVPDTVKFAVGLSSTDMYFNSGLLLINLAKWRKEKIGEKSMSFLDLHHGNVIHHDQGTLNGLLKNKWHRLPLKYNVMTVHYFMSLKKIRKYYKDISDFYDEKEIAEAKNNPAIIHYTPSFTSHPWEENCAHPLRHLYFEVLQYTPWSSYPIEKVNLVWYVKVINWIYRNLY